MAAEHGRGHCNGNEKVKNRGNYWTTDKIVNLIIGTLIAIGLIWLMKRISNVLLPFFAACLIAYLLNPIVEKLQKWMHLKRRILPVFITLLLVTGVLIGLGYLCAPMIAREIDSLNGIIKYYSEHIERLPIIPHSWRQYLYSIDLSQFTKYLDPRNIETIFTKGTSILAQSVESIMRIIEWLLMFIYIIFILIDYEAIARGVKMIFPMKFRKQAMAIVGDVERAMNSYFRGQGFVALCACVLYSIGFTLVGLPLAIVMGLVVGILYMIPYFQYVTLIPVAIICFITALSGEATFWAMFGKCLLVYVVVQSTCDYIITPHVMGKEMGLNPTIILLSLSIWGSLLGILGMIIALPATALILSYYERYISNRS